MPVQRSGTGSSVHFSSGNMKKLAMKLRQPGKMTGKRNSPSLPTNNIERGKLELSCKGPKIGTLIILTILKFEYYSTVKPVLRDQPRDP